MRTIVILSLVGSLLFAAAIGGFLWWYEGNEKDAARTASDDLAAAIEDRKPSKAPDGASDYVSGVPRYFGPVKDAKTVDVRQVDNYSETSNKASHRSWWTSTILLHTERGAALLLVTFADSFDPKDAKVESVRELAPRKVAEGALTKAESDDARRGFASRGGKAAEPLTLDGTFPQKRARSATRDEAPATPAPAPAAPEDKDLERQRREGQRRIKCVQDAQGDVEKLKRCSKL